MSQNHNPEAGRWFDPGEDITNEKIELKIRELLSELTLDEKIEIMDGDLPFWKGMADMNEGGYYEHPWNAGVISRLGIPGVRFMDGPRGVIMPGATTFPVAMARGATWDVDLHERIGEVMGREIRAFGGNLFGGVCVNLLRHPAWGRAQETFGEDPCHLGEMGAALVRGVQKHAMACVKHFAVNSMENSRFKVDVRINARALHEIYIPHFKRIVEEGVAAVMSSYNGMNGEWCGQNKLLLSDILKEKWGFKGFVMTDFMFGMRDAKKAALAGQDLEMPYHNLYNRFLKQLVENGEVPQEKIDDSVSRLLRQQIQFVRPGNYDRSILGCESHTALAREAAEKSIVLLKNEGDVLPLKNIKKLAVIGKLAGIPNTGDGGSSSTRPAYVVTPLEGIKNTVKNNAEVLYDEGDNSEHAEKTAQSADAVIVVVGYTHEDEGEFISPESVRDFIPIFPQPSKEDESYARKYSEGGRDEHVGVFQPGGDRDILTLRRKDEELIRAIAEVNSHVIVVVMGGSAIIMESWRLLVPGIVMLWYPGMEGGHALADILFGNVNPSGKLPFVIPKNAEDLPFFDKDASEIEYDLWHGYRKLERDHVEPAFPFGFGLSYTDYSYSNLRLGQKQMKTTDSIEASLEIANTGGYAGEEIVQLYISPIGSEVKRALKELKAFKRVPVNPGESKTITFNLPVSELAYFNEIQDDFVVELIEYELIVGRNYMDDNSLKARFIIRNA